MLISLFLNPVYAQDTSPSRFLPNLSTINLDPANINRTDPVEVQVEFSLPEKYKLNLDAPSKIKISFSGIDYPEYEGPLKSAKIIKTFPLPSFDYASIKVEATIYYCTEDKNSACLIKSYLFTQNLLANPSGKKRLEFSASPPLA